MSIYGKSGAFLMAMRKNEAVSHEQKCCEPTNFDCICGQESHLALGGRPFLSSLEQMGNGSPLSVLLFSHTRVAWEMGSNKRLAFRGRSVLICEFFARVATINCSPAAGPHTGRNRLLSLFSYARWVIVLSAWRLAGGSGYRACRKAQRPRLRRPFSSLSHEQPGKWLPMAGDVDLGAQSPAAGPHTGRGAKPTGLVSGRTRHLLSLIPSGEVGDRPVCVATCAKLGLTALAESLRSEG